MAGDLRAESRLLDDSYIAQMLTLVKEVGDPRRRPLPPAIHVAAGSLWADLDVPIYVLRDGQGNQPIVITIRPETLPRDVPFTALDLDSELVDQLHAAGYLRYLPSEGLFQKRLGELEREALLSAGVEANDERRARRRQLTRSPEAQALLPEVYWELDREFKQIQAGAAFNPEHLSIEGRWALSAPARANDVMVHLLARFLRYDYRLLMFHHPRVVQAEWNRYSDAKRAYLDDQFSLMSGEKL